MRLSDIKFLKIGDEVILKPSVKGMSPTDPQYNDWVSLKGKTGTVIGKDWQSRSNGGMLISVDVDGTEWTCGPGDIVPATSAIEDRKNDAEMRRKELFNRYRSNVADESVSKQLTIDNRAYLQEAFNRLNERANRKYFKEDYGEEISDDEFRQEFDLAVSEYEACIAKCYREVYNMSKQDFPLLTRKDLIKVRNQAIKRYVERNNILL